MSNEKDFLGKGLRFPVSINLNGGVSSSQLEENVRQSLFVILGTAPGERVNRPRFGCMIHDLMFAPNNPVERNLVFPFYLKTDEDEQPAHNGVNGKSANLENA